MKSKTFWTWSLGVALAALPLGGGCDQESATSAPASTSDADHSSAADTTGTNDAPSPDVAQAQLENAQGQVVAQAATSPQSVNLTGPATDLVKLAQAGVDQDVMLSFVTNSPHTFNLTSDAIIYLNDIGVPGTVVTSMIQHDQLLGVNSAAASGPPVYSNQQAAAPGLAPETADTGQTSSQPNVASNYFYDPLSPYGNWINIEGCGLCWQPTVVVANPGWRPYCDHGSWVNSDCGWYWASDYSWGWAPFHYGRWFHHGRWGWCWSPDTVWGPAWVSWRYTDRYCGWAPLPPTACFFPGIGFSYFGRHVGFDFGFGLAVDDFAFVGFDFFSGRHLRGHLVPDHEVRGFFNRTTVAKGILGRDRSFINTGIPVDRVAAATHTDIHRMHIRDAAGPVGGRFDRNQPDGRTLAVYRPNLPQPTRPTPLVGQSAAIPGRHGGILPDSGRTQTGNTGPSRQPFGATMGIPREHRTEFAPAGNNGRPDNTVRAPMIAPHAEPRTPLVPRIQDRSGISGTPQRTVRAISSPPAQLQTPRVFGQESPRHLQQDQRVFAQPSQSVQRQAPVQSWNPTAPPRAQQHWAEPAPQRSVPSFNPEPRVSAAPRVEVRQAPAPASSPSAPSRSSGQDNNSRRNR